MHTPHLLLVDMSRKTRNEAEVNVSRLSVLRLFGFRKMTYTPRRREYKIEGSTLKLIYAIIPVNLAFFFQVTYSLRHGLEGALGNPQRSRWLFIGCEMG